MGEIAKALEIADKNPMRLSLLNSLVLALSIAACGDSSSAPGPGSDDSTPGDSDGGQSGGSNKAPVAGRDAGQASSGSSSNSSSSSSNSSAGKPSTGNGTTVSVGTVAKDGGQVKVVSASTDGGAADDPLAGFGDVFNSDSDGGTPKSSSNSDGGTPDSCEDAVCFDVFDCAVWHLDSLDCGFTACENFVCVK